MSRFGELPIPTAAMSDAKAIELIRAWASGGKQHISLATGVWNDPASWGIMLVDLAKHIANSYQVAQSVDRGQVLARIRAGFDAEWTHTTDTPQGDRLE